jgi:hypothetical protein
MIATYPEKFDRITTASGAELYQTDEDPRISGAPWGAKHLDLIRIEGEPWVRIEPWPPWCGERVWFERVATLQSFLPAKESL